MNANESGKNLGTSVDTASSWARLGAFLVDTALISTLAIASGYMIFINDPGIVRPGVIGPMPLSFFIWIFILFVVYQTVPLKLNGATPGKKIFALKVISTTSSPGLSWGQALVRGLLSTLFQVLTNVSHAFMFYNAERKQVADYVVKTRVISTKRKRAVKTGALRATIFMILLGIFIFFNTGFNLAALRWNNGQYFILTGSMTPQQ